MTAAAEAGPVDVAAREVMVPEAAEIVLVELAGATMEKMSESKFLSSLLLPLYSRRKNS